MSGAVEVQSERLSEGDARRLTQQIRLLAGSIADQVDRVTTLIAQAETGCAWQALGYQSWTAYCSQEFSGSLPRLDRQARQELVGSLTEAGMSSRAIAPIVGVTQKTVIQDRQVIPPVSPDAADAADECDPDAEIVDAELVDDEPSAPKPITGMDGKNYNRPEPKPPARSPLTVDFLKATTELTKAVHRVIRLTEDDRFTRNADQVATTYRSDLIRARDALQGVIGQLPTN